MQTACVRVRRTYMQQFIGATVTQGAANRGVAQRGPDSFFLESGTILGQYEQQPTSLVESGY